MTDDELQAIRERWRVKMMPSGGTLLAEIPPTRGFIRVAHADPETVQYLSYAPSDVFALLAEVDRLREENRKLRGLIDGAFQ